MRTFRTFGIVFLTWVLWLLVSQYFFCNRYSFPDPVAFEGSEIFNPYDSLNPAHWVKGNFHAHAHAWNGITNGHGTAEDIHAAYDSLQYGVHCVSNYHQIDTTHSTSLATYLPAYEHGYNTRKTHQLVLGSTGVQWIDYLFPQTVHNKQHVLDQLKQWGTVTILNHPGLRTGYTDEDMAQLENYDCMEVLNPSVTSTNAWDAALSAGKRVFIVGDDDIHNVLTKERLGTMCTFVNLPKKSGQNVLEALRTGKSYGVKIGKEQDLTDMPYLKKLTVNVDSVFVEMSHPANEIYVTGQEGKTLSKKHGADQIRFRISTDDHYARTTFHYTNGTSIYLNPVFFTSPSGYQPGVPVIHHQETLLYRTVGILILGTWMALIWRLTAGNRPQRFRLRRLVFR